MEDSSTVSDAVVFGCKPCSDAMSAQSVGVGVPLTAVITCATCKVLAAGDPG